MDAPKGRYRVIEEDGRLVVIDNESGTPIPSSLVPPRRPRPGRSPASPPVPVAPAGPGPLDRAGDFLLAVVAREWDSQGRAVIAWRWGAPGQERRWDAALPEAEQRQMGHALVALLAAPAFLLLLIFAEGALKAFGIAATLPPTGWGALTLLSLYLRTDDPSLR